MNNFTMIKIKRRMKVPEKIIQRLILYRKTLSKLQTEGISKIYSHTLGLHSDCSAAQVRNDIRYIGYNGTPANGYDINDLINSISEFIDPPATTNACVVGIGNLGRAILDYCYNKNPKIRFVASFETDKQKIGRVISGCKCYDINQIETIVIKEKISLAVLAIPESSAQAITDKLVASGVGGFLNYTALELKVPDGCYIENRDMLMALEKIAFFAK